MVGWMIGCIVGRMCVLIVCSSWGLREINPRQKPLCLRALRHARGPACLLPTNNQHTHSPNHESNHPSNLDQPSVRTLTHIIIYIPPPIYPPKHPSTHIHI